MTDHVHDPEQCADCRGLADRAFRVGVNSEAIRLAADTAPLYSEADRQAAYKAGWDDARAVIAEPLDVEGYWERAYWRVVPRLAKALAARLAKDRP